MHFSHWQTVFFHELILSFFTICHFHSCRGGSNMFVVQYIYICNIWIYYIWGIGSVFLASMKRCNVQISGNKSWIWCINIFWSHTKYLSASQEHFACCSITFSNTLFLKAIIPISKPNGDFFSSPRKKQCFYVIAFIFVFCSNNPLFKLRSI